MDSRDSVLIGYTAAVDFCQPLLPGCEQTRQVLEDINSRGSRIDIRQECWTRLTDSLGNSIKVFMTLRDSASKYLKSHDGDTALRLFTEEVLQASILEDMGVDIDNPAVPDIEELEDAVQEMGLRAFREYADDYLKDCPRGQEQLELLIDNRFTKGGESQTFFEASIRRHISGDNWVRLLLGAHSWSKSNSGYLLTRCSSDIHEAKSEIEQCMSDSRFSIVCPED